MNKQTHNTKQFPNGSFVGWHQWSSKDFREKGAKRRIQTIQAKIGMQKNGARGQVFWNPIQNIKTTQKQHIKKKK